MRSRVIVFALAATAALLAATSVAAASSFQPDVNAVVPSGHLSAPAQHAAMGAVARERTASGGGAGEQALTVGTLTFNVYPFTVQRLPPGESTLYFASAPVIPLVDTGLEDADGVRMVMIGGQEFNHVSAQARYGLLNINAYRATGDTAYLARAEVQAQRLIDRATQVGDAWYHPYDYDWGSLQSPWYSALGQGYALSLFIRLYELTSDVTYKAAADATFASFLDAGPATTPWVSEVDPDGYLWLQEYPGSADECVYNGFMVAVLGIYDYYRVTGDPDALTLFRGAATTAADYAASYRQPGWRSLYCLGNRLTAGAAYHEVVVQELLALFTITGDTRFAHWADTFEADYPRPAVSGEATVAAGKHAVVRNVGSGGIRDQGTLSAGKKLHLAVSSRERRHGHPGIWLLIAAGRWKGYWIRESAPRVFIPGELVTLSYSPSRTLTLPAGRRYTFHDYSQDGTATATMVLSATRLVTIQVDAQAVVDGYMQVHVVTGPLTGWWIRLLGCVLT